MNNADEYKIPPDETFNRIVRAIHYTVSGYKEHAACIVFVQYNGKEVDGIGNMYFSDNKNIRDLDALKALAESEGYKKAVTKSFCENNDDE